MFLIGPVIARFSPSPAQLTRWRSQLRDIFHVEEMPWATFYNAGAMLCLLGAAEIAYIQPLRQQQERKTRLQEFFTRSSMEGFEAATTKQP